MPLSLVTIFLALGLNGLESSPAQGQLDRRQLIHEPHYHTNNLMVDTITASKLFIPLREISKRDDLGTKAVRKTMKKINKDKKKVTKKIKKLAKKVKHKVKNRVHHASHGHR